MEVFNPLLDADRSTDLEERTFGPANCSQQFISFIIMAFLNGGESLEELRKRWPH